MGQNQKNFLLDKNLFCFWADQNKMSEIRKKCLQSLSSTELNVIFLDSQGIREWTLSDYPFHEGYKYLSSTHKSDYLRAYFMHHYGGGYCDIKYIDYSWLPAFENLINSENYIEGYPEIGIIGITRRKGLLFFLRYAAQVNRLIGNGAFICKPYTPFTELWLNNVHQILDKSLNQLKKYPASGPLDFYKMKMRDGSKSNYPLNHAAFSGENFHPVCSKFHNFIGRSLKTPDFSIEYK